jgi:hypothetical protein
MIWRCIPSGRNICHTVVVVDGSSKSSSCNDGEEGKEKVKDHLVEAIEIHTENDGRVERFGKMEDILRKSGTFLESGGRIKFYSQHNEKWSKMHLWMIV